MTAAYIPIPPQPEISAALFRHIQKMTAILRNQETRVENDAKMPRH
jgi:hypothetical protein